MVWELLLSVLQWVGACAYGGSLLAFAILILVRETVAGPDTERVVRIFQAWGPGLGLSMAALVYSSVGLYWLQHDFSFSWPLDTLPQQLTLASHLTFLALWASSFHLEIWTLDPVRKLDAAGLSDRQGYEAAVRTVNIQMWVNVSLFLTAGCLLLLAGRV